MPLTSLVERREERRSSPVSQNCSRRSRIAPARLGVDALARLERAQRLEVEVAAATRPGRRRRARRAAARTAASCSAEHAVARELDRERDPRRPSPRSCERRVRVVAVEPLRGTAVEPERRLARGVPEQVDAPARPLVRHGRRGPEPVRGPERAEALAQLGRPVVERLSPRRSAIRSTGLGYEQLVERPRLRPDRARGAVPRPAPGGRACTRGGGSSRRATPRARSRLSPVSGEKK